jgi:hypothetical protein
LITTMVMGNAKGWAKKGQAWQKQGVSMTLWRIQRIVTRNEQYACSTNCTRTVDGALNGNDVSNGRKNGRFCGLCHCALNDRFPRISQHDDICAYRTIHLPAWHTYNTYFRARSQITGMTEHWLTTMTWWQWTWENSMNLMKWTLNLRQDSGRRDQRANEGTDLRIGYTWNTSQRQSDRLRENIGRMGTYQGGIKGKQNNQQELSMKEMDQL